jgi:predicted amidohydrolase
LAVIIDRMSEESKRKYGRDLDLAILPEAAITGEVGGDALSRAVPLDGAVINTFARKAREHRCYIIDPTYLQESSDRRL